MDQEKLARRHIQMEVTGGLRGSWIGFTRVVVVVLY
jgi:hypothetical protein